MPTMNIQYYKSSTKVRKIAHFCKRKGYTNFSIAQYAPNGTKYSEDMAS